MTRFEAIAALRAAAAAMPTALPVVTGNPRELEELELMINRACDTIDAAFTRYEHMRLGPTPADKLPPLPPTPPLKTTP